MKTAPIMKGAVLIIINTKNGTPVLYRPVRDRRLQLLSRLIASIYVDVLEASRCLVSLLTRQAMFHVWLFSFVKRHSILKNEPIHAIPPAVVTLEAAKGSVMEILGLIRFDLQLGEVTRPV